MKKFLIPLFAVMCLAQWIVPGKMIYDSEKTISDGNIFKFKTEPVDPSDPFRGKYVTLRFEADFINTEDSSWTAGENIFVTFTEDSQGFAKAESVSRTIPESENYLATRVIYLTKTADHPNPASRLVFEVPFDRFYLEESKAPQAEELYRKAQWDSTSVAFALVSIGKGHAVLQNVIINDRPIVDIINELNESAE